jgi:putative tryptophan/tyrosine transport system substrate-binding protein
VRRREFIAVLGGTAAWSLVAIAQQSDRLRRIGVLMGLAENDPEGKARIDAFRKGLEDLGWTDGRNIRMDYRWAGGDVARTRTYASALVGLSPDVIFVNTPPGLTALQRETRTVPIVFVQVVEGSAVASLAQPDGNVTGFAQVEFAMSGKWLEMLKEVAPRVVRVAAIQNPMHPAWPEHIRTLEAVAPSFGVQVIAAAAHDVAAVEQAIDGFAREPNGGLIVLPDTFNTVHRDLIVALAARHRLPAVYPSRFFATAGGLMSYGADLLELLRRAASYVDRVLKGDKPGTLPVQASMKFELVINLKTAKALGLEVPPNLLFRADEVIE